MIIQTDGGRYDVSVKQRQRCAVYWEEPIAIVRRQVYHYIMCCRLLIHRCTWFYKGESDRWYMPYEEDVSKRLEVSIKWSIVIDTISIGSLYLSCCSWQLELSC